MTRDADYWAGRRKELLAQMEADEERLNKRLAKVYDRQARQLEREIAAYYQQYGEQNVIRYRDLLHDLSDTDRKLLMERMDDFAEKYPQYADLMPVRESIYKLNRLEGIQTAIRMQQLEIGAIEQEELDEHFKKLAQRSANLAAEEMGFGKEFYSIDSQLVSATVGRRWSKGESYSEKIWNNREKLAAYLNDDFAQMVARGDSYEKAVKALKERFEGVSERDIRRLVFTEGTFLTNEAQAQVHQSEYEYYALACADARACEVCKTLEREQLAHPARFDEREPGVNFPPMHPWCRCGYTIEVPDYEEWADAYERRHGAQPSDATSVSEAYVPRKRNAEQNAFTVNYGKVNSKAYHDSYDSLPLPKPVRDSLYKEAGQILRERDGTDIESLVAIDAKTGKVVASTGGGKLSAAFDESQRKAVESAPDGTVFMHNHPWSSWPSAEDVLTTMKNECVSYHVVVCHDGDVMTIEPVNRSGYEKRWNEIFDQLKMEFGSEESARQAAFAVLDQENGRGKWYKIRKRQ